MTQQEPCHQHHHFVPRVTEHVTNKVLEVYCVQCGQVRKLEEKVETPAL